MVELSEDIFLRRVMSRTRQIGVVLMLVAALVAEETADAGRTDAGVHLDEV